MARGEPPSGVRVGKLNMTPGLCAVTRPLPRFGDFFLIAEQSMGFGNGASETLLVSYVENPDD